MHMYVHAISRSVSRDRDTRTRCRFQKLLMLLLLEKNSFLNTLYCWNLLSTYEKCLHITIFHHIPLFYFIFAIFL